jgi:hypothetical protein
MLGENMNDTAKNPFVSWRSQHESNVLDARTEKLIQQWVRVNHELLAMFDAFDDTIEPWMKEHESLEPDLVGFVAGYGYSRAITGDWVSMPIDIPESELADWDSNSGLFVTLGQLHDYQAGVAGSVAEILHTHSEKFVSLLEKQLKKLYAELDELIAKPIADFAPTQWSDEDIGEQETGQEIEELDRIFDVYEKLWCFEQGIEELRMIMITEDDPEFHLPNQAFYDALKSIDSQKLLSNLEHAKPKLEVVLKFWADTQMSYSGEPYHRPSDSNAPDAFWWRHWSV